MKKCLISLVIWYRPIEITMEYQHPPTKWSKLKETRPNASDNAENLEHTDSGWSGSSTSAVNCICAVSG